jgi:hypothetical protein
MVEPKFAADLLSLVSLAPIEISSAVAEVGKVVDLSGDGKLTKRILELGNGVLPTSGVKCVMHYTGR